ncbi:MAG: hypothetical protein GY937_00920 [bacterium]|nr:hypothetical protein [bacterium]
MRLRHAAALLALLFVSGACAGPADPWHVPKGREGRFRDARKVCHQLTDNDDGSVVRERMDACMGRRGWRRTRWYDRLGVEF